MVKKTSTKKNNKAKTSVRPHTVQKRVPHIKNNVKGKKARITLKSIFLAIGFILLPLIIGVISSVITGDAMMHFNKLNQPPLAPPAWLFPVAWTFLYLLMGIASYLIYKLETKTVEEKKLKKNELIIYFVQLLFNFLWTIFFFRLELRFFAFGWLIIMWLMILTLIILTFKNRKAAAWCLIPYIIWCTFAAYLNIVVAILN